MYSLIWYSWLPILTVNPYPEVAAEASKVQRAEWDGEAIKSREMQGTSDLVEEKGKHSN